MSFGESTPALVLFAHGSSVEEANRGVHELAATLQARGPYTYVRAAFLELGHPDFGEAVEQAVNSGHRHVIVVPYFLTMGIHLRRDLPNLIAAQRQRHPDIVIEVTDSLEGHPLMPSIILQRIQELENLKATR